MLKFKSYFLEQSPLQNAYENSVTFIITTNNRKIILGSVEYLSLCGSAIPDN
jgi:hypothetical protein